MFISILLYVFNVAFNISALIGFIAYLTGKKCCFKFGLFNNSYWLVVGTWFGWWANIVVTLYFMGLNAFGLKQWGNKPIKQHLGFVYTLLALALIAAISVSIYTSSATGIISGINIALYAITYTLRPIKRLHKLVNVLFAINQVAYLPQVLTVTPILWPCVIRQAFMAVCNIVALIKPNLLNGLVNKLQKYCTHKWFAWLFK